MENIYGKTNIFKAGHKRGGLTSGRPATHRSHADSIPGMTMTDKAIIRNGMTPIAVSLDGLGSPDGMAITKQHRHWQINQLCF